MFWYDALFRARDQATQLARLQLSFADFEYADVTRARIRVYFSCANQVGRGEHSESASPAALLGDCPTPIITPASVERDFNASPTGPHTSPPLSYSSVAKLCFLIGDIDSFVPLVLCCLDF